MYKTRIARNWTLRGRDEEPTVSDDGIRIGMLLWSVCCAVALRRLWYYGIFRMWSRMRALCEKYEIAGTQ